MNPFSPPSRYLCIRLQNNASERYRELMLWAILYENIIVLTLEFILLATMVWPELLMLKKMP